MRLKKRHVLLIAVGCVIFLLYLLTKPYLDFMRNTLKVSPLKALVSTDGLQTIDNKVNIVLLGIAGGTHDGPNLSDSITFMSYDFKEHRLASVGIPRDVYSSTLDDKINSAYAYGEAKQPGNGTKLAKAEVSAIVGLPVHYAVVINFEHFKTLIDYIGGIDVTVARSFSDHEFPITGKENDLCGGDPEYGCRYKTVSFTKGITHMNGETALEYVRSRHAQGEEGTDFARSQRQQLVLSAIKSKILKPSYLLNLMNLERLYDVLNKIVVRDMTNQQAAILAKNILFHKDFTQDATSLKEDLFYVPPVSEYGRYVLLPKNNSWTQIHNEVRTFLHIHIPANSK